MKGVYFKFALLALCLGIPAQAALAKSAEFLAGDLSMMCTSTSDVDFGYCAGYISAHADQMLTDAVYGLRACNHQKVRSQQLVDTFNNYIELFPESKKNPAGKTVAAAIARAFPCNE